MAERRKHRAWPWAAAAFVTLLGLSVAVRFLVRDSTWAGPMAADALRMILGRERVSRLEEWSADVEDRWHALSQRNAPPRALSEVERAPLPATRSEPAPQRPPPERAAAPRDVGPMDARVAAPGDGVWRAVSDPTHPEAPPILFTTMLHPDSRRPWTEAFVVTFAVSAVQVHAVAGTIEPRASTTVGQAAERPGLVPSADQMRLLAVFNGGFKAEHGQHGMFVDGVALLPPRRGLCTIVGFADGSLAVGTWERLSTEVSARPIDFWRQAAPCLVEAGITNPALADATTRRWGAALAGETVIRRSAFGLDAGRATAFVAITNDTSAPALAAAMRHAGATDVAQLDVNWSYPKFVLFPADGSGVRRATSLFAGFLVGPHDFIRKPYARDFFYVVAREPSGT